MTPWQLIKPTKSLVEANHYAHNYLEAHPFSKVRVRATKEFSGYKYVAEYHYFKLG